MNPTRVFWFLFLSATVLISLHGVYWEGDLEDLFGGQEYLYEQRIRIKSSPGDFRLSMFIPAESATTSLRDENLELGDLSLKIQNLESGRRILLEGGRMDRDREFIFSATISNYERSCPIGRALGWSDLETESAADLAETELIQARDPAVANALLDLLGLDANQGGGELEIPAEPADWHRALRLHGITPEIALERVFAFCQTEIAPANFSGTTDALTALNLGEASCGGKSRLMTAMCRSLGIPTRLSGGVIMGEGDRKRSSHVWLECRLGEEWVPFDPLNNHFASLPANYLLLYRGDHPLILHSRSLGFDYAFSAPIVSVPGAWRAERQNEEDEREQAARIEEIPLLSRSQFSLVLLVPFALLLTVFARQVIGIDSMGTFLPILIGFSLTQTGWLLGGVQFLLTIAVGLGLRFCIARLQLLNVPRNAVLISFLVIITLLLSALLAWLDLPIRKGAAILPLAALAMTVERYTAIALDKGNRSALLMLGQTALLAAGAYLVLSQPFYKNLTVAFPEVFLLILAELIIIGNYRGLRLRELWRFRRVMAAEARTEAST